MTSSARNNNDRGIVNPSAFAVFMGTSSVPIRPLDREIGRRRAAKNPVDVPGNTSDGICRLGL